MNKVCKIFGSIVNTVHAAAAAAAAV